MVYKRKANVLFISSGDPCRALMAAAFANSLGQRFISARAVTLQPEPLPPQLLSTLENMGWDVCLHPEAEYPLNAANLAWADLVVALDEATALACPALPEGVQKRCYPFARPENLESLRQVRDAIQQRVAGMVGGMAMINI